MASVLLMNASGKSSQKVNRNLDVVGTRKEARREAILQTKASVVLVQESDFNIDSFLPRTGRYPNFGCIGSKTAAIFFRTSVFALTHCASMRREISALCDELEKTNILSTDNEIMPRLCVGQLQMLSNDLNFLFISWCGPSSYDIEKRKLILKDMATLVDIYMVGKPVYIVIGGDFNLKYDDVKQIVSEFQSLHLCECSKQDRFPDNTRFFIISKPMTGLIGDVHVFNMNNFLQQKYDVSMNDRKYVLSHDPRYLNIHL